MTCDIDGWLDEEETKRCPYFEEGECVYHKKDTPETVAVDLDGTIMEIEEWNGHNHFGKPKKGAKEALKKLKKMGYKIIIWTTRFNESKEQLKNISKTLKEHNIPFDHINKNPHGPPDTSRKIPADYYIDDRAISFNDNWKEITKKLKK